jgi:hypothetical protein
MGGNGTWHDNSKWHDMRSWNFGLPRTWDNDEEYRGYLTEGWGTLRFRVEQEYYVSPEAYAGVIKEIMDEMDGI